MTGQSSRRAKVPASFFVKLLLPFALPILVTAVIAVSIGNDWPRHIAPPSGLKLAGFCAMAITGFLVWCLVVRGVEDNRAHKFAAILCVVTSLMGWPVWSVGVLPSVNGLALGVEETVPMTFVRTEWTHKSKSRDRYHWVWLRTERQAAPIASGRYFISADTYRDLSSRQPEMVEVQVARGFLGAMVVTAYGRDKAP